LRVRNHFYSKVFTKQKSRGEPNSLAELLTCGALTNRVTIQAIPRRSCAASTAFSYSTTATAGGSCAFTGSTRALITRFRRNIFNAEFCGRWNVFSLVAACYEAAFERTFLYGGGSRLQDAIEF